MAQSRFSEATTMGVMSKLKQKGIWLEQTHATLNSVISMMEDTYLECYTDDENYEHLLLKTMEKTSRSKTVATYMAPKFDKEFKAVVDKQGKPVMECVNYTLPIKDDGNWVVQAVRGGKAVRYTLTAAKRQEVVAMLNKNYGDNGLVTIY